jgi:hypothetical protein
MAAVARKLEIVPVTTGDFSREQVRRTNEATRFKPGQSGNPAGRPKGSKHKLAEAFVSHLYENWTAGGAEVIERVRREYPVDYLKIVVSLLPKETTGAPRNSLEDLTDEELEDRLAFLRDLIAATRG